MTRCKARIKKTYKRAKAEVVWPRAMHMTEDIPEHMKYPECGGEVTFKVRASGGGYCCHDSYPDVEVDAYCSRCKNPYFDGVFQIPYNAAKWLEEILNGKG